MCPTSLLTLAQPGGARRSPLDEPPNSSQKRTYANMPTYEVTLHDGRTLHIDADDQNAALAGAQHFLSQNKPAPTRAAPTLMFDDLPKGGDQKPLMFDDLPAATQDAPVTTGGLAKATGAGAVSGFVGLPGDVVSLINLARKGYARLTGGTYNPQKDDYSLGAGYQKVRDAADQIYQPQNNAESWAKTVGEFAPALVTGPEDLLAQGPAAAAKVLAKRAALQAAVPAMASEAAGAATKGTEVEPYARAAAAVLAGGLGTKKPSVEPLTADAVGDVANKNFTEFRAAPVTVKSDVVEAAAKDIQNSLRASGLSKAPANDLLTPFIDNTTPVALNQLQETRSLLGKAARSDTPEGVAAIQAKKGIDALMEGLQPSDTVVGANALVGALRALKQGRSNSAVQNQLGAIEAASYRGDISAAASHAGDNTGNAIRQQIAALLKSKQAMAKLAPYRSDMESIVQGGPVLNTLRRAASLTGGNGGWHTGPYWLGALLAEPFSGTAATALAAMPFVGMGLKKLEGKLAQNKVDALRAKIAANARGVPQPPAPNSPWPARTLIGALATNGNGSQ